MNSHKNAKLTARGREEMIRRLRHEPAIRVAAGFSINLRIVRKWAKRHREGGSEALADRSSRPKRCRSQLSENQIAQVYALRKQRLAGDDIALRLGFCRSSVFRALRRLNCSRLSSLEPKGPALRYEWEKPGQMLHLDIKKLGTIDGVGHKKTGTRQVRRRRPGWEYLPTAKLNGLSAQLCKSGHMPRRTLIPGKGQRLCLSGRSATIFSVLMALLTENLRPQD